MVQYMTGIIEQQSTMKKNYRKAKNYAMSYLLNNSSVAFVCLIDLIQASYNEFTEDDRFFWADEIVKAYLSWFAREDKLLSTDLVENFQESLDEEISNVLLKIDKTIDSGNKLTEQYITEKYPFLVSPPEKKVNWWFTVETFGKAVGACNLASYMTAHKAPSYNNERDFWIQQYGSEYLQKLWQNSHHIDGFYVLERCYKDFGIGRVKYESDYEKDDTPTKKMLDKLSKTQENLKWLYDYIYISGDSLVIKPAWAKLYNIDFVYVI